MTDLLPVPAIESAEDPALTPADVGQRWRALMGELGFGERLIWIAFVGPDRRFIKALHQVSIRPSPKPQLIRTLMEMLCTVVDELEIGVTVALLITRPGVGGISKHDLQWVALLTESAAQFGVPLEPIFRANDEALVQILAATTHAQVR